MTELHDKALHETFDLLDPLHRRDFFRRAGQSSLTAGLLAAGVGGALPTIAAAHLMPGHDEASSPLVSAAPGQKNKCPDLKVFAKRATNTTADVQCETCTCNDATVVTVTQRLTSTLSSISPCDETKDLIPDGSLFQASLIRRFRFRTPPEQCPVGCHDGKFQIQLKSSSGSLATAFTGTMTGTDGLNVGGQEPSCCARQRDEGAIRGKGKGGPFRGCTLKAAYTSFLDADVNPQTICLPETWRAWTLNLLGILACPCK